MLKDKIDKILGEINSRAKLVVAVKYANAEQMQEIVNSGVDIAFNTLQQFEKTSREINLKKIKTHFIGNIQSNKIAKIIELKPELVQSVSSFDVAEKINSVCKKLNIRQKILLQINTDLEKNCGFKFDDLENCAMQIKNLKNVEINGLMTIPPTINKIGEPNLRKIYKKIKLEYENIKKNIGLNLEFLSMGMSLDYIIAIEEGSNMIRIGRKIFS